MTDVPDAELLEQFARNGSEVAFAALVERHLALVHSVALRHTTRPHQAQDITQAVFIILARKAGTLSRKTVLSGWLYHTARLTAANFRQAEMRRIRREQEAFMQSTLQESANDTAWREMSPQLDEAMAKLGMTERDALVLRYFQNKSMAEVGQSLGLQENAAQKRVGRALEKLRKFFAKRGVVSTTAIIAGVISANSVQAAPAGMAQTVSSLAVIKGTAASTSTLTLVKGVLKIMAWSKMNTAIAVGIGILLVAGTATVTVKKIEQRSNNWQLADINAAELTTPPWRTEVLPTRSAQRSRAHGTGGMVTMADGRVLQINASAIEMLGRAYFETTNQPYQSFSPARMIVDADLPRGQFDFISSEPLGAKEALQDEIRKKFGLTGDFQTITTNVLFLEVKYPNAPGLKLAAKTSPLSSSYSDGFIQFQNAGLGELGVLLELLIGTPVVDQTHLPGNYAFQLKWKGNGRGRPKLNELRTALNEQLGLDLVEGTAPVDMLVVTKAN